MYSFPPRLPMLNRLGTAVNAAVEDLLADADAPGEILTGPGHAGLAAVREAMSTMRRRDPVNALQTQSVGTRRSSTISPTN
jgi:hypothetical protein